MADLRVGIIGIGNIGYYHATNIFNGKVSQMQLAAVCDLDPKRLKLAKETFGNIGIYQDYQKLFNDAAVEAVIIATPHYLHPVIAVAAFEKGLHVLIEKPAGVRVSDVKKMNQAAESSGKVFGIMWNQRTNNLFLQARNIVQSGQLGRPKRLVWIITNWYRTQAYYNSGSWRATWAGEGGGVLLNQAPHNLDLMQWIFGMPKSVRATCKEGCYHDIEVEDEVTLQADYENGATALFVTTTGEYPGTNRLEISGSRGKMVLENGCLTLTVTAADERDFCREATEFFPKIPIKTTVFHEQQDQMPHIQILENFAQAVLLGKPLLAPGSDGIHELTLSNAAYLSSWKNGEKVFLPFDTDIFDQLLQEKINHSKAKATTDSGDMNPAAPRWQVKW